MLRGVPDIIGSDLLKALADTGHGDLIVIADHFYPPVTKSPNAISIQAKGNTAAEMVDAVLAAPFRWTSSMKPTPSSTWSRMRIPALS